MLQILFSIGTVPVLVTVDSGSCFDIYPYVCRKITIQEGRYSYDQKHLLLNPTGTLVLVRSVVCYHSQLTLWSAKFIRVSNDTYFYQVQYPVP